MNQNPVLVSLNALDAPTGDPHRDKTHRRGFQARLGWDVTSDGYINIDVTTMLGRDRRAIAMAAQTMILAATNILENLDDVEEQIVEDQFGEIMERNGIHPSPGDDVASWDCPDWDSMTRLDQALLVEHVTAKNPAPMRYANHPVLTELPDDIAHLHALHLAETHQVPQTLSDFERAEMRELAAWHREQQESS